jgi:beta-fructofuranosidase
MLLLADRWVWDHWLVDTGTAYHLFYLQAPRSLGDPELRHLNATTGHAVSHDLVSWRVLPDALGPGAPGSWDDATTWTGSIVGHEGRWYCFYTGSNRAERSLIQRIGLATSDDLVTWVRHGDDPVMVADPRWYEQLDLAAWHDQAFRDPWVFRDPDGHGWHALITARTADQDVPSDARGVIGHAWSADLVHWEVRAPLSAPGEFGHLEVPQTTWVEGRAVLVFCALPSAVSAGRTRRLGRPSPGTYACAADSLLGPFHVADARLVTDRYAGRLVQRRDGTWAMLGFIDRPDGEFVGAIGDPLPIVDLPGFEGLLAPSEPPA